MKVHLPKENPKDLNSGEAYAHGLRKREDSMSWYSWGLGLSSRGE